MDKIPGMVLKCIASHSAGICSLYLHPVQDGSQISIKSNGLDIYWYKDEDPEVTHGMSTPFLSFHVEYTNTNATNNKLIRLRTFRKFQTVLWLQVLF